MFLAKIKAVSDALLAILLQIIKQDGKKGIE
jgi:hypothetical protein